MSQSGTQFVQGLYEAFGRGDAATVLACLDPEIVWMEAENIPYADRNPYRGPQQVGEGVFGRIAAEWDGFTVTPERMVEQGDHVVVMGRYRGTYRATGQRVNSQFVHAWTLRAGRAIAFQQYADTLQFARVMGQIAGV